MDFPFSSAGRYQGEIRTKGREIRGAYDTHSQLRIPAGRLGAGREVPPPSAGGGTTMAEGGGSEGAVSPWLCVHTGTLNL